MTTWRAQKRPAGEAKSVAFPMVIEPCSPALPLSTAKSMTEAEQQTAAAALAGPSNAKLRSATSARTNLPPTHRETGQCWPQHPFQRQRKPRTVPRVRPFHRAAAKEAPQLSTMQRQDGTHLPLRRNEVRRLVQPVPQPQSLTLAGVRRTHSRFPKPQRQESTLQKRPSLQPRFDSATALAGSARSAKAKSEAVH